MLDHIFSYVFLSLVRYWERRDRPKAVESFVSLVDRENERNHAFPVQRSFLNFAWRFRWRVWCLSITFNRGLRATSRMLHPVYPDIFARSGGKRTKNRRWFARETRRGRRGEKKSPESTRETRGREWEKVNVIAVIFGRWLLPGSSLFPPLGHLSLPPPSISTPLHLRRSLCPPSLSPFMLSRFLTCIRFASSPLLLLSLSFSLLLFSRGIYFSPLLMPPFFRFANFKYFVTIRTVRYSLADTQSAGSNYNDQSKYTAQCSAHANIK